MKKQFLFLIAFTAICSMSVMGQRLHTMMQKQEFIYTPPQTSLTLNQSMVSPTIDLNKGSDLQSLPFTNRFVVNEGGFLTFFAANTKPFCYEPFSNTLAILYSKRVDGTIITDTLQYLHSTNGGATWATRMTNLMIDTKAYQANPQLGLGNLNESKNFDDLSIFTFTTTFKKNAQDRYPAAGATLYYKLLSDKNDPIDLGIYGPKTNNSAGYLWGSAPLHHYHNSQGDGFVAAGVLAVPDGSTVQYGQYGVLSLKSMIEDDADIIGTIPKTWENTQFLASPNTTSSYNGPMYSGTDNNGTIYACNNAVFADDKNARVVAFSKSTDRGSTWTTFVRMPQSVMDAYAKTRGGDNAIIFRPYHQAAFVVTGVEKFSYFARLLVVLGQDSIIAQDIAEVMYDNGTWSVRRVAPFRGTLTVYNLDFDSTAANNYDRTYSTESESSLGNEIEVATTADGSNLILKWVDYNTDLGPIVISPAQTVYQLDNSGNIAATGLIDTMYTTDIYVTSRPIASSSWSTPSNVTNDLYFDKGTKMPAIVPSTSNIPLISMRNLAKSDWNTNQIGTLLKNSPELFVSALIDLPFRVATTKMATIVSVEDNSDDINSSFSMSAVSPNPVNDNAEVAFTSNINGNAQLNVYNTLGEKVLTVFEGMIQSGVHGFNINSTNLASGSYIVNLTINGKTQTRTLNIIH